MLSWLVAIGAGLAIALLLYGAREPGGLSRALPAAALRALALALLLALLLDAPAGPSRAAAPLVALDASASWMRGGDSARWRAARDAARRLARDTLWLFGDSLRPAPRDIAPTDLASRAAPVAERALAAGRPVVLVTDGEVDDAPALGELPAGSRIETGPPPAAVDAAIVTLDAPRAVVAGDTIEIAVALRAGNVPVPAGRLVLLVETEGASARLAELAVQPLGAGTERRLTTRAPLAAPAPDAAGPARGALLVAALSVTGDAEPRNDTLRLPVEIVRAAGAVLASTSPDLDARYLVPVLRGAVSLPTRAFYEVTPGSWRLEGSLAPVAEREVRAALREAPLAIIHGDTAAFGAPRALGAGSLVLLPATPAGGGEWYPVGVPPSPVAGALSGLAWDSLPPLEAAPRPPRGEFDVLAIARARESERRVAIAGSERTRRVVVAGASGFWRWAFRGGAGADAFTALWGGIFDWASAGRTDRRAAVPAEGIVRAGERIRWRRGAATDTTVRVVLRARPARAGDAPRADSVTLRFGPAGSVAESGPLAAGVYDVELPGGRAVLAVNASLELVPRPPSVRGGATGARAAAGVAPRLRDQGWPWLLALAALCAEWLLRRRLGLR